MPTRLVIASVVVASVLLAGCDSGSNATPTASVAPSSSGTSAADLAASAGCTDATAKELTSTDVEWKTVAAVSCTLDGKTVQIYTYESEAATKSAFKLGRASYQGVSKEPAYVVVGPTWVASESATASRSTADRIAKSLGGTVENLAAAATSR